MTDPPVPPGAPALDLEPWQVMGAWVHEAMEAHPALRGKAHGIHFMPLPDCCYVVTEDGGRDVEYRITSPRWCVPLTRRGARELADQLVTGLRERVREARRAPAPPGR